MPVNPTAQKILTAAQKQVQIKGFNGFSYRNLAAEVGIKTSSIHYHFPTKDDLALELVTVYREKFNVELEKIVTELEDGRSQLEAYVKLFEKNLEADNKFCLCGMLASEVNSLSEKVKQSIRAFFVDNERWLSNLIRRGQADGSFQLRSTPELIAAQLLATFEGAMLIARSMEQDSVKKFHQVVVGAMQSLE